MSRVTTAGNSQIVDYHR